jgi:hypothetical protein
VISPPTINSRAARNAQFRVSFQARVEKRIQNLITELVRVSWAIDSEVMNMFFGYRAMAGKPSLAKASLLRQI